MTLLFTVSSETKKEPRTSHGLWLFLCKVNLMTWQVATIQHIAFCDEIDNLRVCQIRNGESRVRPVSALKQKTMEQTIKYVKNVTKLCNILHN